MATGSKRKRIAPKGLQPGEKLRREKLAGAEAEHSQWGWVSVIGSASQITREHKLAACGFLDRSARPICQNKYDEISEPPRKKRKTETGEGTQSSVACEDADEVIIISSDEDDRPLCNKKLCKNNPHCLNYLGQERLENEDEALKAYLEAHDINPNPSENARDPNLPVGLKNLGATCYANAFIQERHLWDDHAFREGVYRCIPSQEDGTQIEDSPIFQLQVTFAALQESNQNVFNPVKLVESLQLRASEQQDAQEFSKLFMTHLATEFEKQAVPSLKTLLTDQFEGKLTYGTMCKKCQNKSERDSDFLELEISLSANGKLEDRIKALLQSEELTGDNKYHCAFCDSLQDAVRYTKLRQLPPVLHFSVLRFVFDLATLSRKKSKQIILFPPIINMSPFLEDALPEVVGKTSMNEKVSTSLQNSSTDLVYELRGVLLHKGASAYHGHYEAQVYDVVKKQFYQFNDEIVTPMKSLHDKRKVSEEREANGHPAGGKPRKNNARKKRVDDSDVEEESNRKIDDYLNYISSKDAYMLIYARRESAMNYDAVKTLPKPPPIAKERVAALNQEHDDACAAFTQRQLGLTNDFKIMRQAKRSLYQRWQIDDLKDESAVVSRSALERWLCQGLNKSIEKSDVHQPELNGIEIAQDDSSLRRSSPDIVGQPKQIINGLDAKESIHQSDSPDPLNFLASSNEVSSTGIRLDNSSLACEHGALDPQKANEMKRIKRDSLLAIQDTGYFIEPEFTTDDICMICLEELFLERKYALDHANHVAAFDQLCESEEVADGTWISKAWLRDWRQPVPKMHVIGKSDPDPEASSFLQHIKCPHGQLSQSAAFRRWINADACAFLRSIFPTWIPTIVSADTIPNCPSCERDISLTKEAKQEIKQRVDREKERLKGVISSYVSAMEEVTPDIPQALIGADFVRQWRAWINKPYDQPRPQIIDSSWLICQHGGLVVDPSLPEDLGSSVVPVSFDSWISLLDFYDGGPLVTWVPTANGAVANDKDGQFICKDCRYERLRNFDSAVITVRLLSDEIEPALENNDEEINVIDVDAKQPANTIPTRQRDGRPLRSSNRLKNSRRRAKKTCTIQITKESTVKDIKIDLQDEFNIPTICQQLFHNGKELVDNAATVASLGILASDSLELKEEKEQDGLGSDVDMDTPAKEGRAFGGTILDGGRKPSATNDIGEKSCPACTFLNPDGVTHCMVCESSMDE